MSGLMKKIGKTFKKVVRVVKKIAPYALTAAAVVFTGGAALGLTPTFGAAVGGLTSSLGLTGALGTAVTGAITNAGFGAAVGGLVGGEKGMKMGALAGAVSGGLMGPIGGAGAAASAGSTPVVGASQGAALLGAPGSALGSAGASAATAAAAPAAGLVGATTAGAGGIGGLLGNPLVTSNIVAGLGQGLMAKAQAQETRKDREAIAANYNLGENPFGTGGANQDQYATDTSLQWAYDPKQGKLVRTS